MRQLAVDHELEDETGAITHQTSSTPSAYATLLPETPVGVQLVGLAQPEVAMKEVIIVVVGLVVLLALAWWNGSAKDGGFEDEQARKYRGRAGGTFGGGFWG